jgi:hypothetical protein
MSHDYETAAKSLLKNLKSEALELIDFDQLADILTAFMTINDRYHTARTELGQLRQDYRRRLLGMLKAMLVSRPNKADTELAAALADDDDRYAAAELVRLYERTAARFRDRFPAGFKYLNPKNSERKSWREYKI